MATRLSICVALIVFMIRVFSGFDMESSMIRSAIVFLSLFIGFKAIGFSIAIINDKKARKETNYKETINSKQAG